MVLDHKSRIPLHKQAEEMLRKMIEEEEYKDGKTLPNEVDLAARLNISRNTLRQAINQLVFEGLLERKKGVGTKVSRKGITVGVQNWHSFSQEMKMLGIEIKNYELAARFVQPPAEVCSFFNVKPGKKTSCLKMERLRGNPHFPFVFFISYFNPKIPMTGQENFSQPLYEMLQENYGIVVKTSKEEVSARLAGEQLARKLWIAPGDAILSRKRFVYDENGIPIEYNIGYYRADSFTYSVEATR